MSGRGCPYFDPDYDTLILRLHPPSVEIDNESSPQETLVKVDSTNKNGILLEVVQVLTDLDLTISKAYISSDGFWFMDVFHVKDQMGNKITDENLINYIQESLGAKDASKKKQATEVRTCLGRTVRLHCIEKHTAIEIIARDKPGFLSEISGVLRDLNCNVVAAEVWTHNLRVACVVYITDEATGGPVKDEHKLLQIKERLCLVLEGEVSSNTATTDFSTGILHTERRLHQLMLADCDYENCDPGYGDSDSKKEPLVSVHNCVEKGYSVVSVQSKDRPKLLFDVVCTLTDLQYVVFHAAIRCEGPFAYQEYYIRHTHGYTLTKKLEQERVIKCLKAAVERRASQGVRLELCTQDRLGLLSDVTKLFQENGLSVAKADVTTQGDNAVNVFYVTDVSGGPVDMKAVEAVRQKIGETILQVKDPESMKKPPQQMSRSWFSFGNLLQNIGFGKLTQD